jgi:hypothetical protein
MTGNLVISEVDVMYVYNYVAQTKAEKQVLYGELLNTIESKTL